MSAERHTLPRWLTDETASILELRSSGPAADDYELETSKSSLERLLGKLHEHLDQLARSEPPDQDAGSDYWVG